MHVLIPLYPSNPARPIGEVQINQSKLVCFLVVTLVVVIGGSLRYQVAQQDLLWLDELHTSWVVSGDLDDVSERAHLGNQSPLFFWLTWSVIQQQDQTASGLRMVSLVAGIALIFAAGYLAWIWTQSVLATLVSTWWIAIDPTFVFYATEARPYALLQLLGVLQVISFWQLLKHFHKDPDAAKSSFGRPPAGDSRIVVMALFVLSSVAVFYSHYTGVWLFVSEALFISGYIVAAKLGWVTSFQSGRAMIHLVVAALAGLILCLPAMLHLLTVYDRRENWVIVSSVPGLLDQLRWPFLLGVVLPIVCAAIFYFPNKEAADSNHLRTKQTNLGPIRIPLVLLWGSVPVAMVILVDSLGLAPLALQRYTMVGLAAFPLFAALCVNTSGKWFGQLLIALILIATSFIQRYENRQLVYNPFVSQFLASKTLPMLRQENWNDPIDEINRRDDKREQPVFLFSNLIEDVHAFATEDPDFHDYLRFPVSGIHSVDGRDRVIQAAPTMGSQHFRPTDIELMKRKGGAWLIIRGDQFLVGRIGDELRAMSRLLDEIEQTAPAPDQGEEEDPANSSVREPASPQASPPPNEPTLQFAQFPMSHIPGQNPFPSNVYLVSVDW